MIDKIKNKKAKLSLQSVALMWLLLGSSAFGQSVARESVDGTQSPVARGAAVNITAPGSSYPSEASVFPPGKPLITIYGLCNTSPAVGKKSSCKTVITRADFEKVIDALQPGMPMHARSEFAEEYAETLIMAHAAAQLGLDEGPTYAEQMRIARLKILSEALKKSIKERASHISEKDVERFYKTHKQRFEKAEVDRIFVPRGSSSLAEVNNLRARATNGANFAELQTSLYRDAGAHLTTALWIRRISLPPSQSSVMDMKPGEVSQVLRDPNGYYVYRLRTKGMIPLDQARNEITEALRSERIHEETSEIMDSATTHIDPTYFEK
jgi:peptidyl-prolyl cis-trans isomerase C